MDDELLFGAVGSTARKGHRLDYYRSLLEKEQFEVVDPTGEYGNLEKFINADLKKCRD